MEFESAIAVIAVLVGLWQLYVSRPSLKTNPKSAMAKHQRSLAALLKKAIELSMLNRVEKKALVATFGSYSFKKSLPRQVLLARSVFKKKSTFLRLAQKIVGRFLFVEQNALVQKTPRSLAALIKKPSPNRIRIGIRESVRL